MKRRRKTRATTVRLPLAVWREVEALRRDIRKNLGEERSRNEVLVDLVRRGFDHVFTRAVR